MRIVALDLSTKRIGYAAADGSLGSITAHAGAADPYRRLHELARQVEAALTRHGLPDLAVVEDYALGAPGRISLVRLGEIGGVIRTRLFELTIPLVLISNGTVKMFATGDGSAKKPAMIAAARKLGAPPTINDDEADAFHLRRMALAYHQQLPGWQLPLLSFEAAALEVVKW